MPEPVAIDPLKLVDAAREFATHTRGRGRPRPVWLATYVHLLEGDLGGPLVLPALAVAERPTPLTTELIPN